MVIKPVPQEKTVNAVIPKISPASAWLVTLVVPVALILSAVRILLTPAFVQFEYHTPGFPPDPYGFTLQDRLRWSLISLEYLLNDEDISFVADLRFADGTPVYNPRELRHMDDTKNTVQAVLIVWYLSLAILLGLALSAWRWRWWSVYRKGISRGGWLTVILVLIAVVAVGAAFNLFFFYFHETFFESGTYVFRTSDTFIRLFPERFWRDAFLAVGALSMVGGLAFGFGFRLKNKTPLSS